MAGKQEDDFDYEDEHIELESDKYEYGTDEDDAGTDTGDLHKRPSPKKETSSKTIQTTDDNISSSKPEKLPPHNVTELAGKSDSSENKEENVDLLEGIEVETEDPPPRIIPTKKRSAPSKSVEPRKRAVNNRKSKAKKMPGAKNSKDLRPTSKRVAKTAAPKKAASKKSPPAKRQPAKRQPAKRQPAKKVLGKKAPAKKAVPKKAASRSGPKKAASKKIAKRRR